MLFALVHRALSVSININPPQNLYRFSLFESRYASKMLLVFPFGGQLASLPLHNFLGRLLFYYQIIFVFLIWSLIAGISSKLTQTRTLLFLLLNKNDKLAAYYSPLTDLLLYPLIFIALPFRFFVFMTSKFNRLSSHL